MKKGEKRYGFTVIEVALVIAVAGVIFLMVIVALPALRASQRDATRRENVISFINKVKQYQKDNRGTLPGSADNLSDGRTVEVSWNDDDLETSDPTSWAGFYRDYLGANFFDPNGEHYQLKIRRCDVNIVGEDCGFSIEGEPFPNNYEIIVATSAVCKGQQIVQTNNQRKLAAAYRLESGGVYCENT